MRDQLTRPARAVRRASSVSSDRVSRHSAERDAFDSMTGDVAGSSALAASNPIDVAVAMQSVLFGDVLFRALARLPGLRVVSCGRGEDGVRRILELKPQVLLLDEEDLERNGNFLRHLSQVAPTTRILVMAMRSSKEKLESVRRDGARGIVEMGYDLETLGRAIEAVAAGRVWAHRATAAPGPEYNEAVRSKLPAFGTDGRLTKREWEIAERVGRGLRNKDIALRLNISQETVKAHLNNIFRKLQLDSRVALGILALSRIEPKNDA